MQAKPSIVMEQTGQFIKGPDSVSLDYNKRVEAAIIKACETSSGRVAFENCMDAQPDSDDEIEVNVFFKIVLFSLFFPLSFPHNQFPKS
jgi:hypothetical protein